MLTWGIKICTKLSCTQMWTAFMCVDKCGVKFVNSPQTIKYCTVVTYIDAELSPCTP